MRGLTGVVVPEHVALTGWEENVGCSTGRPATAPPAQSAGLIMTATIGNAVPNFKFAKQALAYWLWSWL